MKKVVLVGNSNVGKTTFFNSLSGLDERTGNWAGVTVGEKSTYLKNYDVNLTDLPGIYSFDCFSLEEEKSKKFLENNPDAYIVNVVECKNLSRNLFLTMQLLEMGFRPFLVVNMADEVKKRGGSFYPEKIEKELGIPVFVVDARNKGQCERFLKNLLVKHLPQKLPAMSVKKDAEKIYEKIDGVVKNSLVFNEGVSKIEKLFFGRFFSLLLFFVILASVFWLVFAKGGIGGRAVSFLDGVFANVKNYVGQSLSEVDAPLWLNSFVSDVLLEGVAVVAKFTPQVALLLLFLNMLEDTGYISRIAFMLDGLMQKAGLGGKSVFTLILSLGCNTTAVAVSGNLENKRIQRHTLLVSPFFPCGAKMPVYFTIMSLAGQAFEGNELFFAFLMYAVCFLAAFVVALTLKNFENGEQREELVMELPPMRMPSFRRIAKNIWKNVLSFMFRLAGMLFFCVALVWFLKSFDASLNFCEQENSLLYSIGQSVAFLFKPIGIDDWRICVSLVLGLTAKEVVAGTMALLFAGGASLSFLPAMSALIFVSLYTPCFATIAMIKKQCGTKTALLSVFINTFSAYAVCFLFCTFYKLFSVSAVLGFAASAFCLFVALIPVFVVKYKGKCFKCAGCVNERTEKLRR